MAVSRRDLDLMKASGTWAYAAKVLAAVLKGKAYAEELAASPSVTFD